MSALERVSVVVPARDEAESIADVVGELRRAGAARVVVVDNASRDGTSERAREAGAEVVQAPRRGYGWACLAGVRASTSSELIGFIDGDGSFAAGDLERLAALVARGEADVALGARRGPLALAAHQRAGNALVLALLRSLYGLSLSDIAPLRVVRTDLLRELDMRGSRYAWLVEMLAKAARCHARIAVLPVAYGPRRGGTSKVSGSLRGSVLAGLDFVEALFRFRR
ncbi:MAG: glycosyltransferase family 2 protein [Chloroflexota bacterium]|nr:glycosyltransferase family 2 protein [Chloroflexota bacterium]